MCIEKRSGCAGACLRICHRKFPFQLETVESEENIPRFKAADL
jgi:hypothetical protein